MTYTATIDAPWWYRRPVTGWRSWTWPLMFGWVSWATRLFGWSRKWEAQGDTLEELDVAFRRLAGSKGLLVSGGPISGYTIMSLRSRDVFTVEVSVG